MCGSNIQASVTIITIEIKISAKRARPTSNLGSLQFSIDDILSIEEYDDPLFKKHYDSLAPHRARGQIREH